jgi:hypothetical protein
MGGLTFVVMVSFQANMVLLFSGYGEL